MDPCVQVPFHDVKFRGYGLNKIAHVATLNYYNFSFMVLPGAWLVHRPHEDTAVSQYGRQQQQQLWLVQRPHEAQP